MRYARFVLLALAIPFAACSDSDSDGPLERLGIAACQDLRDGLSFFQIAQSGLNNGMSEREVASAITLGVEDHCPEFRNDYRQTIIWREWQ